MKAKVVSIGVSDDRKDGYIGVRLGGTNEGVRFTFIVPVSMAVDMGKANFIGADVDMEITLTLGDLRANIT